VKSAVETLSPTRVRLTVEVPFEELSPSFEAAYREIARQVNIPGFRRGKVPRQIIDQRFGRQTVIDQAVNDAIPRLYFDALQENDVEPMGQPTLDVTNYADGSDLTFTAEVEVRPEVTLPEWKGLEVDVEDADVTDESVEEQVSGLRERFGSLSSVERAAGDGDYLTLDLSASKDGEPIEEAQAKGLSYQIGSGSLLEGLDDAVRGLSAGESARFVSQLVSGEYADQDVDVDVTVEAVKEQQLPDFDDDFAQLATEFDTLDELRADLRQRLERVQRIQQAQQARDAVLEKLLELVDIPLPDDAIAGEIEARRESTREQITAIGLTVAQYLQREGQSEEEFDADLEKRARDAMKAQFVLDKVADDEELSVSEAELTQTLVQRAQQAGVSPEDYAKQVVEANYVPTLVREVRRGKALAAVVDNAVVKDASGRHVELRRLQPDGTLAGEGTDEPAEGTTGDAAAETEASAGDTEQAGQAEENPATDR
jgi:trigger factor